MEAHELEGMTGRRVRFAGEAVITDARPANSSVMHVRLASGALAIVPHELVAEILPEPIKVGDRVKTSGASIVTVLAVYGDEAWVLYSDGSRSVWRLSSLTLVEPRQ